LHTVLGGTPVSAGEVATKPPVDDQDPWGGPTNPDIEVDGTREGACPSLEVIEMHVVVVGWRARRRRPRPVDRQLELMRPARLGRCVRGKAERLRYVASRRPSRGGQRQVSPQPRRPRRSRPRPRRLACSFSSQLRVPFDAHAQAKMQVPVMTTTHNQSRPVRETAAGTAILAFSSAAVSGSSSENPL
jgi:hypothetical protein